MPIPDEIMKMVQSEMKSTVVVGLMEAIDLMSERMHLLQKQVNDLQHSNNGLLERARAAEAKNLPGEGLQDPRLNDPIGAIKYALRCDDDRDMRDFLTGWVEGDIKRLMRDYPIFGTDLDR